MWALFADVVQRFGRRPTLIEWDTDLPPLAVLLEEAARAAIGWRPSCRSRCVTCRGRSPLISPARTNRPCVAEILPAAERLRIHRHHVLDSLAAALAATFPTVQAVVGAEFFRGLARAFIGRSLPTQPVLAEYGAGFPAFIAGHDAARDLPYLADVARLDWALNLAFHAPAGGRLAAADLAALPADRLPSLRLSLAPGTVLVCSPYPLDRIWAAAQPGAAADPVDLAAGGVRLLVLRRPDDAAFVSLSAGRGGLRRRPRRGADLGGGGRPGRTRLRPVGCLRPAARSGRLCCVATWLPCWHHNCAWFVRIGRVGLCCTARQVAVSNSDQCCGVIDHPYTPRASRTAFPQADVVVAASGVADDVDHVAAELPAD